MRIISNRTVPSLTAIGRAIVLAGFSAGFSIGLPMTCCLWGCGAGEKSQSPVNPSAANSQTSSDLSRPIAGRLISESQESAASSKPTTELPTLSFGQTESIAENNKPLETIDDPATALVPAVGKAAVGIPSPDDDGCQPKRNLGALSLVAVDPDRIQAAGLQIKESKHLQLIYEPGSESIVGQFPKVFDLAVGQWINFFAADPKRFSQWKVTCFFIVDLAKFQSAGLIPDARHLPSGKLPPGGWEYGNQIWVNQHPGNYYNRHMLLHEGTHAFCFYNFGALGPPWLAEGVAEYLAVHSWRDGHLKLADRVTDKNDLEYWGRVRIIQDAWFDGVPKSLGQVMSFPPAAFPATESYAWSWAAVLMFDQHPNLHDGFHATLAELHNLSPEKWNRKLLQSIPLDSNKLKTQWEVLSSEMTYGYDMHRAYVRWSQDTLSDSAEIEFTLPADGAWHQTDHHIAAGKWGLQTDGMYQIAKNGEELLISSADGVSYQYFHGARIGELEFAVEKADGFFESSSALTSPMKVGSAQTIEIGEPGRLFMRINDDPRFLDDNDGVLNVKLKRIVE